jgi:hypothetical protein
MVAGERRITAGKDVHTAADIVGACPDDDSVERSADGVCRRSSENRCRG